jgi:hypothetical protein
VNATDHHHVPGPRVSLVSEIYYETDCVSATDLRVAVLGLRVVLHVALVSGICCASDPVNYGALVCVCEVQSPLAGRGCLLRLDASPATA